MSKSEQMYHPWKWHWRVTDGEADCGIYVETRPGHAYSICRCPRYLTEDQWREYATHICDLHNAAFNQALATGDAPPLSWQTSQ